MFEEARLRWPLLPRIASQGWERVIAIMQARLVPCPVSLWVALAALVPMGLTKTGKRNAVRSSGARRKAAKAARALGMGRGETRGGRQADASGVKVQLEVTPDVSRVWSQARRLQPLRLLQWLRQTRQPLPT